MQTRIIHFVAWACLSSVSFLACSSGDDNTTTGTGGSTGTGGGGTGGSGGGTPASLSASGCYTFNYSSYTPGATARTLKADVQPIFQVSCALGGCHLTGSSISQHPFLGQGVGTTASAADLTAIMTELTADSKEATSVKYMVPNQPENSWMMMKLDQDPQSCNTAFNITCVLGPRSNCTRMPQGTNGLMPAQLSTIRDWIKQGANVQ